MGARTGAEFLAGLRERPRAVWVDGERIGDVTVHPRTRGAAASLARVFDRQHDYADECLFTKPDTGQPTNLSHLLPRSQDDIRRRHTALVRLSEASMGLMGRTPDYMNMKFSGFASAPWVWAGDDNRNEQGAANLVAFQNYLADDDIALTHTIIQPTTDKRTDYDIVGNTVTIRKVGETGEGIVVRERGCWRPWPPLPTSRPSTPPFPSRRGQRTTRSRSPSPSTPPA